MQRIFDIARAHDYFGKGYMCVSLRTLYADKLISHEDFLDAKKEICSFLNLIGQLYIPEFAPIELSSVRIHSIRGLMLDVLGAGTYAHEDISTLCENIYANWDNRLRTLLDFMNRRNVKPLGHIWDKLPISDLFKTLVKHKFYNRGAYMCHSVGAALNYGFLSQDRHDSVLSQINNFMQVSMDTLGINFAINSSTSVNMLLRHEAESTEPIRKMCAYGAEQIFADWVNRYQIFNLCHTKILRMGETAV